MAAIRKTLAHRLSFAAPSLLQRRLLVPSSSPIPLPRFPFLQKRPFYHPALDINSNHTPSLSLPTGNRLVDRIRELNPTRLNLDGLVPPPPLDREERTGVSVEGVRKVLRASRIEAVRARLRSERSSCVSYEEFVGVCGGDQSVARALDESGAVIVIGDVVFLRPHEVAKAIENLIPMSPSRDRMENHIAELRKMEEEKAVIDRKAELKVKRELWCGLGFLVVQTAAFMRLTFWELSWDVMEPICFYVTSTYFMACYGFFLRTSKEPSFEGFFDSRFATKQRRLMAARNFDINRYMELRQTTQHHSPPPYSEFTSPSNCHCCSKGPLIGSLH